MKMERSSVIGAIPSADEIAAVTGNVKNNSAAFSSVSPVYYKEETEIYKKNKRGIFKARRNY